MKPSGNTTATGSGAALHVLVCDDDLNQQLLLVLAAEECNVAIEFTFVDRGVDLMILLHQRMEFGGLPDLIMLNLDHDGRRTLGQLQTHSVLWQIPVLAVALDHAPTSKTHSITDASWCVSQPTSFEQLIDLVESLPARAAQSGLTSDLTHVELTPFDLTERPIIDLQRADASINVTSIPTHRSELDL